MGYTYNQLSPFKFTTQFTSYMGPYMAVEVHSNGWGSMSTYADNKAPAYEVHRGKVYVFNGQGLNMWAAVESPNQAAVGNGMAKNDDCTNAICAPNMPWCSENVRPLEIEDPTNPCCPLRKCPVFLETDIGQGAAAAAAILANPDKFADAAKTMVEAQGEAIENVNKAIGALKNARNLITSSTPGTAIIINASPKSMTWYTYNQLSPFKFTTQFTSYMGPYMAVEVHSN